MNYTAALRIAYPLRDNLASDINRHLSEEDREQSRLEAVREKASEILACDRWLNTLEDKYPQLLDVTTRTRNAILRGTQDEIDITRVDLQRAYRNAARDLAARLLVDEARENGIDAAFEVFTRRQECEA